MDVLLILVLLFCSLSCLLIAYSLGRVRGNNEGFQDAREAYQEFIDELRTLLTLVEGHLRDLREAQQTMYRKKRKGDA